MRNKPQYALDSVDNALRLIQLLRDQGRLRVTEAAEELGIGRSTAHRLLAMLVYRGFAEQDETRGYLPGPSLTMTAPLARDLQQLRAAALPAMERLCERVEETINLVVRAGTQTRFVATVESRQILHVGDRRGAILPAARTSGGKALLARLTPVEVETLYGIGSPEPALPDAEWKELVSELKLARRRGYAVNPEGTEAGLCAVGMVIGDSAAALSIAMPSVRYSKQRVTAMVRELRAAAEAVELQSRT
ncbi:IclR family transcriptional regulator [Amycolatopsis alkalitolerans]|uniref:IclR family transcriptional regulator n=1 Tax=Amycolatopsis alkalitolerans TaxID=2547244 RepID=A0A5C4LW77_9PSEU|nr:IclR family transcriptional regulator [Amycolatopsis alkalitolerans]TNC22401.1 IclR family transcriptional regulator [Amycolatopsis alkalitolerans]